MRVGIRQSGCYDKYVNRNTQRKVVVSEVIEGVVDNIVVYRYHNESRHRLLLMSEFEDQFSAGGW